MPNRPWRQIEAVSAALLTLVAGALGACRPGGDDTATSDVVRAATTDAPTARPPSIPADEVLFRIEDRCRGCAPLFGPPGPTYTVYGDGTTIYARGLDWFEVQMTPADITRLWQRLDALGLLGEPVVDAGDQAAEDEWPRFVLVRTDSGGFLEHVTYRSAGSTASRMLTEVLDLADELGPTPWEPERWIGPGEAGFTFVDPSDVDREIRRPVMPDMGGWTIDQMTYGAPPP